VTASILEKVRNADRTKLLVPMMLVLLSAVSADSSASLPSQPSSTSSHFVFVHAYIDPKGQPLAAYQFELTAKGSDVTLVGVEGGEQPAFADRAYYDPKANAQNRIVIAAFNTGDNLPNTRTRVATIMLRVGGTEPPVYTAKLDVAASSDAKAIDATIQVSEGAAQ
jgi:hypothetical protein